MRQLRDEFIVLGRGRPESDALFRTTQERFQSPVKKANSLKTEAKVLIDDALDVGLTDSAVELDAVGRMLRDVEWEADASINESKMNLGMFGGPGGNSAKEVDLRPPLFSGELSELDFYTFKAEFEEYASVKSLTRSLWKNINCKKNFTFLR